MVSAKLMDASLLLISKNIVIEFFERDNKIDHGTWKGENRDIVLNTSLI
jgi:hypothetical protein